MGFFSTFQPEVNINRKNKHLNTIFWMSMKMNAAKLNMEYPNVLCVCVCGWYEVSNMYLRKSWVLIVCVKVLWPKAKRIILATLSSLSLYIYNYIEAVTLT